MNFYWNAWSQNEMKTKTFSVTEGDILNCLHLNVVYINFASDLWTVLRTRVTNNIVEVIRINNY